MKKPRPQDFDPQYKETNSPEPDQVNLSGVVAIKPRRKNIDESKVADLRSSELPNLQTSEVTNLPTSGVPKLQSYELRNFDQLRRLDIRLTYEQKRFLDDLEETIRQQMPEGERNNPEYRRITKNSIIRIFVEIFRQLDLRIKADQFKNETDLLTSLYDELLLKLTNLRTSELTEFQTS